MQPSKTTTVDTFVARDRPSRPQPKPSPSLPQSDGLARFETAVQRARAYHNPECTMGQRMENGTNVAGNVTNYGMAPLLGTHCALLAGSIVSIAADWSTAAILSFAGMGGIWGLGMLGLATAFGVGFVRGGQSDLQQAHWNNAQSLNFVRCDLKHMDRPALQQLLERVVACDRDFRAPKEVRAAYNELMRALQARLKVLDQAA